MGSWIGWPLPFTPWLLSVRRLLIWLPGYYICKTPCVRLLFKQDPSFSRNISNVYLVKNQKREMRLCYKIVPSGQWWRWYAISFRDLRFCILPFLFSRPCCDAASPPMGGGQNVHLYTVNFWRRNCPPPILFVDLSCYSVEFQNNGKEVEACFYQTPNDFLTFRSQRFTVWRVVVLR